MHVHAHVHAYVCASAVPSLSLVNYASLSLRVDELAASCLALQQWGKKKPAKAVCAASTRSLTRFPLTSVFSALHLCVVYSPVNQWGQSLAAGC